MTSSETVTTQTALVLDPAPARARSVAGAYLRATATNCCPGVEVRPDYGSRVFFYSAFELIVRRRFRWDSSIAEIARSVATAAGRHAPVGLPALEAEMLIRDALGEVVPIEDISLAAIVTTHVVIFAALVDELALTDDELDALIVAAEDRAAALGHPARAATASAELTGLRPV